MLKLFFKKLILTIIFIISFFLLVGIIAFLMHLIFGDILKPPVSTIIISILAFDFEILIVSSMRYEYLLRKTDISKSINEKRISFGRLFLKILKNKVNIVHTIAFVIIVLAFCLTIAVREGTPWLPLVVGTLMLLIITGLLFLIINTVCWCIVHRLIINKNLKKIK